MEEKNINQLELVRNFMENCQQWNPDDPKVDNSALTDKDIKNAKLRLTLTLEKVQDLFLSIIEEEVQYREFDPLFNILRHKITNLNSNSIDIDKTSVAVSLCDINYINNGTAIWLDLPLNKIFEEVHRSNMSKLDPILNKPILRDDGKVVQGPSYSPPNVKSIIDNS